jgi:hypothetical protein
MFLSEMATRVVVPAVALPDSKMLVQGAYAYNIGTCMAGIITFPISWLLLYIRASSKCLMTMVFGFTYGTRQAGFVKTIKMIFDAVFTRGTLLRTSAPTPHQQRPLHSLTTSVRLVALRSWHRDRKSGDQCDALTILPEKNFEECRLMAIPLSAIVILGSSAFYNS